MLDLVVVVADTAAEDAQDNRENDDYGCAYLSCQIPLVFVYDLIFRKGFPIVNKVIPLCNNLAYPHCVKLIERLWNACRKEVFFSRLLLKRIQLLEVEAIYKFACRYLILLARKEICLSATHCFSMYFNV
jgi:hypothetical protein